MDKGEGIDLRSETLPRLREIVENFLRRAEDNGWRMFRGRRLIDNRPRKIIPAHPPATYHRVRDAKQAIARCHRWHKSNPVAKAGSEPRHIRENYDLARRQLEAAGVLSAR